jgi:hypothetical protein
MLLAPRSIAIIARHFLLMLSKAIICVIVLFGFGLGLGGCIANSKNTVRSENDHNKDEIAYLIFCRLIDGGGGDRKNGTIWIAGPAAAEEEIKERYAKTVQIRCVEEEGPSKGESDEKKRVRAEGFVVKDISIKGDDAEAYGGSREGWFRFQLKRVNGIWSINNLSVEAAF